MEIQSHVESYPFWIQKSCYADLNIMGYKKCVCVRVCVCVCVSFGLNQTLFLSVYWEQNVLLADSI